MIRFVVIMLLFKVCSKPLCKMCSVLDHDPAKGHVIKKIGEVYDEERQTVNELTKKLEDKIAFAKSVMKVNYACIYIVCYYS